MKSVKHLFEKVSQQNPNAGDYINLAAAIKGKKFSERTIALALNKFVPKSQYRKSESKGLLKHLNHLSNMPVEGMLKAKNRQ